MRLIDSDALKSEIIKTLGISEAEKTIWEIIDMMPTLEPRALVLLTTNEVTE